ncbi:MAG: hypothetical protein LBN39_09755 [Planctomycetaceae bacterium]|nr:hypothetical protein [Planctomycetaceae bacterium]
MIPKNLFFYWFAFLGGGGVIALLESAYIYRTKIAGALGVAAVPALDISQHSSILNWGVSTLLFATAAVCYANYQLGRKYKDPIGQTAAWFWMSAGLVYLSLDTQTELRDTLNVCLTHWSGTTLFGNLTWWLALYLFLFGIAGSRIAAGMFSAAVPLGFFVLAAAGITAEIVLGLNVVPAPLEPPQMLIIQTAVYPSAVLMLFLSFTLFARQQVFRDPDTALQWFARTWKQEEILKKLSKQDTVKEKEVVKGKQEKTPAAEAKPQIKTVAERPVIEKPKEKDTKKDTDFDLQIVKGS